MLISPNQAVVVYYHYLVLVGLDYLGGTWWVLFRTRVVERTIIILLQCLLASSSLV